MDVFFCFFFVGFTSMVLLNHMSVLAQLRPVSIWHLFGRGGRWSSHLLFSSLTHPPSQSCWHTLPLRWRLATALTHSVWCCFSLTGSLQLHCVCVCGCGCLSVGVCVHMCVRVGLSIFRGTLPVQDGVAHSQAWWAITQMLRCNIPAVDG